MPLPPRTKGWGAHSPAAKGMGESQFRRLRKSLALCLLSESGGHPHLFYCSTFHDKLSKTTCRSELIRSLEREIILEIDGRAPNPFNISAADEENEFEPEENDDFSRYASSVAEPVFVNLLKSPGIDSRTGRPVRQPCLSYRPASLHRLAESIHRNRFLCSINIYKYGLWYFYTFKEPRNRFQRINFASLHGLAGRYNNPIPTRLLAPICGFEIPAQL